MSQINARPGMKIHQVLKRTGPEESHIVLHQSDGLTPHQNHPAVVGDVPHSPDSIHPEHGSDVPAVSWSVAENAQSGQSDGDTAGSMKESESGPCSPVWQSSVGEKSVVIPSPSYNVAHIESQPSPAQNMNTGADGG
ncbi:hypothetical protein A2U01_0052752, partial [Trifolium medium]|nr:hypothetical protein [Trifolium medium]